MDTSQRIMQQLNFLDSNNELNAPRWVLPFILSARFLYRDLLHVLSLIVLMLPLLLMMMMLMPPLYMTPVPPVPHFSPLYMSLNPSRSPTCFRPP